MRFAISRISHRRHRGLRFYILLSVAVFLAYGVPCTPLGDCHGEHIASTAAEAIPLPSACATGTSVPALVLHHEKCHEAPPDGAMPRGEAVEAPDHPLLPVLSAPVTVLWAGLDGAPCPPSLPGARLAGFGLAEHRTGAAALAALCVFRT
ncbi:hypothetical protein [Actinomadura macra]|uniref:hypothetical protein n=1 Tax=Actinomadura macra TaxID=46164 RepID=UPI0012FB9AA7|nr:hypothetical protein [Actinomadura macra]